MSSLNPSADELNYLDWCSSMARKYGAGWVDRFHLNDNEIDKRDKEQFAEWKKKIKTIV